MDCPEYSVVLKDEQWTLDYKSADTDSFGAISLRMRGATVDVPDRPLLCPRQVHGNSVIEGKRMWCLPCRPETDGILLTTPDCVGMLRFADCFPVIVMSVTPFPWILMLHSGYSGTLKNIVSSGVTLVNKTLGKDAIQRAVAWIGPGIGSCCYFRMEEEPLTLKGIRTFPRDTWEIAQGRVHFDIAEIICQQLVDVGLRKNNISKIDLCTSCNHSKCYSYRRGDRELRMILTAKLKMMP